MVDDFDQIIVKELERDGRIAYSSLAKKLGVNVSTVSRRVARLIQENIIRIVAVPSPKKLGYRASAVITMDVELSKIDAVCDKLVAHSNVHYVAQLFGGFDILIIVQFHDDEMLLDFIKNDLSCIEGIVQTQTYHIAGVKKRYGWYPKDLAS